jgi:hypothetical protein
MQNYDYIIIGAGRVTSPLAPLLKERGIVAKKTKPPFYQRGLTVIDYAGTAIYSAEATPLGIGSLSSIMP